MEEGREYLIYTDGSCVPVPGHGGWGMVIVDKERDEIIGEFSGRIEEYPTTNNVAELFAIYIAIYNYGHLDIKIFSDSQYAINAVTKWGVNWEKNGWRTSTGGSVKNVELIRAIRELIKHYGNKIKFEHVRGHRGNKYNELADRLANRGRTE